MNWILEEAKALQETIVKDRRWLHRHAEVGEHLPETVGYVKSRLEEMGIAYQEICECGLVVLFGQKIGKCIILRADMDALPMKEESGLAFASLHEGAAHTCGHDMHTAMMLAVCRILQKHENEICGTIKVVFQPAEEVFRGAQKMIDAGLLENPSVDAAVTLHVTPISPFPLGSICVSQAGPALASCDIYRIRVIGKGCHGATPEVGVDPIAVGAHIVTALQQINAREIAATDAVVLTQGSFHAGNAPNAIPSEVVIEGTIRTFDDKIRQKCLKRCKEMVSSIGTAFGAKATFDVLGGCAPLYNDIGVRECVIRNIRKMLGSDKMIEKPHKLGMASEDFGNIVKIVPGVQISLVVNSIADGGKYPPHNPKVIFIEDPMYIGTAALTRIGMSWLEENR